MVHWQNPLIEEAMKIFETAGRVGFLCHFNRERFEDDLIHDHFVDFTGPDREYVASGQMQETVKQLQYLANSHLGQLRGKHSAKRCSVVAFTHLVQSIAFSKSIIYYYF